MALPDKREEAERLYVRQLMSCPEIAAKLEVDQATVYRWKAEAVGKGEALDWESKREVYNLSPLELLASYAEAFKEFMLKIKQNPELFADPKVADAIAKHFSVMKKIDVRGQYFGVVIDLVKVINIFFQEHEPELKEKLAPHWDSIYEALKSYITDKGVYFGAGN